MKDFVFKCWLCFFGGGKVVLPFYMQTFTALLPNEWAVCALISTNKIGKL